MKTLTKITAIFTFALFLSTASFGESPRLTDEQKVILATNRAQSHENFHDFHAVLNVFQLAILETPELSKKEKKEALEATLTLEQEALLEAHQVLERAMKEDFKRTLSDGQKAEILKSRKQRIHS